MTSSSNPEEVRSQILALVREYHRVTRDAGDGEFVPGQTSVPYGGRVFDEQELVNAVDASLDFWLTYGRFSEEFEMRLAEYLGTRWALLVNSGSSANLLAFAALTSNSLGARKIERGDEVITVAAGFPTTVAPVIQYGAVPVFVDVDLETANVDVTRLDEALTSRTKAVMLAHTLGNTFNVDEVLDFCRRHGLWLIEDNCDALGSRYKGGMTGTFGDISTCSFYPPHHMTMGEGGAVCTSDPTLHRILLSMRDWGRGCNCRSGQDNRCGRRFEQQFGTLPAGYDHKYVYSEFGYNLKATDIQAAIGCAQLDKLPGFVSARRSNFQTLKDLLRPCERHLLLPQATEGSEPSWFGFLISVRPESGVPRDALVCALESARVQTRMLFAGNIIRQPAFDQMRATGSGYRIAGDLANTDRIMREAFWVGVYPGMTAEKLQHIALVITQALGC